MQLGAPSACQRRRRQEPPTPHAVGTSARQGSSTRCESSSEGAALGRALGGEPSRLLALTPPHFFHTLAASAHVMSGKQPSKLSTHHP